MEHRIQMLSKDQFNVVEELYEKNVDKLEEYIDLLLWWNQRVNLVSREVSRETIVEHVKHSLFISISSGFQKAKKIIDAGSGGGLPGIPLAICFPEKNFGINDIVSKKVFAINDMIQNLNLRNEARGIFGNISEQVISGFDLIITKHAFKMDELSALLNGQNWASIVFLKGHQEAIDEFEKAKLKAELNIIRLDSAFMNDFYLGKSVVELKRDF